MTVGEEMCMLAEQSWERRYASLLPHFIRYYPCFSEEGANNGLIVSWILEPRSRWPCLAMTLGSWAGTRLLSNRYFRLGLFNVSTVIEIRFGQVVRILSTSSYFKSNYVKLKFSHEMCSSNYSILSSNARAKRRWFKGKPADARYYPSRFNFETMLDNLPCCSIQQVSSSRNTLDTFIIAD